MQDSTSNYKKVLVVAFVVLLPLIGIQKIYDPDFFWHLKVGELIVKNKTIPIYDTFSYISQQGNVLYYAHEWLFDVMLYGLYNLLGHFGANLYVYMVSVFNISFMYKIVYLKTGRVSTALITSFIYFPLLRLFLTPRPMLLSLAIFLTLIYIMELYIKTGKSYLWVLPILTILLANSHGGSLPVFFAIVSIYLIFNSVNISISKLYTKKLPKCVLKNIFLYGILCIPALAINPHGFNILKMIYTILNEQSVKTITEWRSLFSFKVGIAILLNLIFPYITLILTRKKVHIMDLVFICTASFLVVSAVRHIILFTVFNCTSMAAYIDDLYIHLRDKIKKWELSKIAIDYFKQMSINLKSSHAASKGIKSMPIIFLCIITISVFGYKSGMDIYGKYPEDAVKFIRANNIDVQTNIMFNEYGWGGYLIYNNLPVFIDGRIDIYLTEQNKDVNVCSDYISIMGLKKNWKQLLKKNNIKYLLLKSNSRLGNVIRELDTWGVLYEDDICVIYERKDLNLL